jgi:hypothetical protein
MTDFLGSARVLAESLSEALNCAAYVLQNPAPSPEVLNAFFDATDELLRAYERAHEF